MAVWKASNRGTPRLDIESDSTDGCIVGIIIRTLQLRQRSSDLRFHNRNVRGVDRAVRIEIGAKVRRGDQLVHPRFGLTHVRGIDGAISS